MIFITRLAWQDLRHSGRSLWVFCACLLLGVALVAATGGLYRIVSAGLQADTRALLGGDVEVDTSAPLPAETLQWMQARGRVTLVRELYTMIGNTAGDFIRVELQSMDEHYPLYGALTLQPDMPLTQATAFNDNRWGLAVDASLAEQHKVAAGDTVFIGDLEMTVRALVTSQPDRNLTAQWRGAPVLIADAAVEAAGLTGPGARIDYDYKVATSEPAEQWRDQFYERFGEQSGEVRTFEDRSERIAERLGQIASGLMIIAFSTLFIGGLGVFSSVRTHLQSKLKTIATLRSTGLRNGRLAAVYLLQIAILSTGASAAGCVLGGLLAGIGAGAVTSELPVNATLVQMLPALIIAFLFGCLTAYVFALPVIGRALSVSPATLFRDNLQHTGSVPKAYKAATAIVVLSIIAALLVSLPDPWFALGFIAVVIALLGVLELVLVGVRYLAKVFDRGTQLPGGFALRLALANLHRPGSPLRSAMLSLGSALTVLVACTLVVTSLLRTVYDTIPQSSPSLVLYDIENERVEAVVDAVLASAADARVETAPLVRARIEAIGEQSAGELFAQGDNRLRRAINNEHKLSYRGGNIDGLDLIAGAWWPAGTEAVMSLEDREANRLGVAVGDYIQYQLGGKSQRLQVRAIHSQKGVQTRFWFEGIVADGLLEGVPYRQVGTVFLTNEAAIEAQKRIAAVAPNVITVRTERLLTTARDLLGQATSGLLVIGAISLLASTLVLVSVIAAGRSRQIYEATVLNTLGARRSLIEKSLRLEFFLLAVVTVTFAVALGSAIALPLLEWRMKLPASDLLWVAILAATGVATTALWLGLRTVRARLRLTPARLLRDAG
jgi:putative ABC transport system permease protein